MPEDEVEIPPDSGNVYCNEEPTKSFRPIREKLLLLNKEVQKLLDQKNGAKRNAAQLSDAIKKQQAFTDSRDDNKCLVCFNMFYAKQDMRLVPCGHAFHTGCLAPWLADGKNHCPSCQLPLMQTVEYDGTIEGLPTSPEMRDRGSAGVRGGSGSDQY
jgi:hypothetical protein